METIERSDAVGVFRVFAGGRNLIVYTKRRMRRCLVCMRRRMRMRRRCYDALAIVSSNANRSGRIGLGTAKGAIWRKCN